MKMMIEALEMTMITELMMIDVKIRVVKFSAIHSFDIELLRITFYSFFSRTLSDSSFSFRSKNFLRL